MNEKEREGTFIPCGDSLEKMSGEISDNALETVSGGSGTISFANIVLKCSRCGYTKNIRAGSNSICPSCGGEMKL